jgi:hypothetical protein
MQLLGAAVAVVVWGGGSDGLGLAATTTMGVDLRRWRWGSVGCQGLGV